MKPLRIAIVDDDCDDRAFFEFLFKKNQHFEIVGVYDAATSAFEALGQRGSALPDVILMDLYMPVISGEEALEKVMGCQTMDKVQVFLVSGSIKARLHEKYAANPRVTLLDKPVTLRAKNDIPGLVLEKLGVENHWKI